MLQRAYHVTLVEGFSMQLQKLEATNRRAASAPAKQLSCLEIPVNQLATTFHSRRKINKENSRANGLPKQSSLHSCWMKTKQLLSHANATQARGQHIHTHTTWKRENKQKITQKCSPVQSWGMQLLSLVSNRPTSSLWPAFWSEILKVVPFERGEFCDRGGWLHLDCRLKY